MRSLLRSSLQLGGLSAAFIGLMLGLASQSIALPKKEIIKKLKPIPVFTIADQNGSPLVLKGENNQQVTNIFMSKQDAEKFVKNLQQEKPDLAKKVEVMPQSLGEVYQLEQENQSDKLQFAYVPRKEEVQSAVSLLKEQGKELEQFAGVPLYTAKQKNKGYLTMKQNGQQFVPFFFDKEQLQGMINQFKQNNSEKAKSIKIEVLTLESILNTLEKDQNQGLQKVQLIPSKESLKFLQSIQQQQQNSQ